ncbi:MAG: bifunctional phosphoribosylaminoimidazolecarboxamide formyltransferase/IMP cyclohydrolase [Candidatus Omnitrophica bacterium]|nr:bifunctional phosphoribosylaminoimidazolecarboxamide formyltransferase/IMP cyclohydrolase [Candidatus Omnitrophota bacterium]
MVAIKRALISVSNKDGLESLAKVLISIGVEIISTGGTARFISSLGIKVRPIGEVTGFPEMLDGRVKTLHPKIHGGLLYLRSKPEHIEQARQHGIAPIDMVVVNLYPFQKTVSREGVKLEEAVENIDIGGPSIVRSAAKNYASVAVLTNPSQYAEVMKELQASSASLSIETLKRLAVEAFKLTSEYDSSIYGYLKNTLSPQQEQRAESSFAPEIALAFEKAQDLRYGENPHQRAAFYRSANRRESSVASAKQLHGKEFSYNNIMDMDAALEAVKEFSTPAACIIKHSTPCGVATADTLARAYADALECDKLSAFGGIIGFNMKVDINTAEAILSSGFIECIIAAGYEQNALQRLMTRENLRLVSIEPFKPFKDKDELHIRKVAGGALVQERDLQDLDRSQLKIVTQQKPTAEEVDALLFAWKVVKHVKSNAIVLTQGTKTVGIGAGQMSRVDSVYMALHKAGDRSKGAVLASDAFFPKEDAVELAVKAGVTSIIQPGGSKADEKIVALANHKNISMVFTGIRHFRH